MRERRPLVLQETRADRCLRIVPSARVLYGCPVRTYVAALAWVAVGCALYGWQILSLVLR